MAVSIFTLTDLRLIAQMGPKKLDKFVNGRSCRDALNLMRNLQISLTHYSKLNSASKNKNTLDGVQGSVLLICKKIEIAARNAYFIAKWRRKKAEKPNMTDGQRWTEKQKIMEGWEKIYAEYRF